ncbi:hypothetical protein BH20ACI3_BH20ACI3_38120 [soil metagenome]
MSDEGAVALVRQKRGSMLAFGHGVKSVNIDIGGAVIQGSGFLLHIR